MIYFNLLLILPAFSFLIIQFDNRLKVTEFFVFTFFSFFIATRFDFGGDQVAYFSNYLDARNMFYVEFIKSWEDFTILYNSFVYILSNTGLPFSIYLWLVFLLYYLSNRFFLKSISKENFWVSMALMFILYYGVFFNLIALRQSISLSFFLIAYVFWVNKKNKPISILFLLFSLFFHPLSLILILVLCLLIKGFTKNYLYFIIFSSFFVLILFTDFPMLPGFKYFMVQDFDFGGRFLLNLAVLVILYFVVFLNRNNEDSFYYYSLAFFVLILFASIKFYFLYRVASLLIPFCIVALNCLYNRNGYFFRFVIFCGLIFILNFSLYSNSNLYFYETYRSILFTDGYHSKSHIDFDFRVYRRSM
ncbi:MAG: hypothetical protein ACJAXJ_003851 [Colwellia sp.]|jgi:hypothetical protein